MESGRIHLHPETICAIDHEKYVDAEGGYSIWDAIQVDNSCYSQRYGIQYDGLANKTTELDPSSSQTAYSLETANITFALTSKSKLWLADT